MAAGYQKFLVQKTDKSKAGMYKELTKIPSKQTCLLHKNKSLEQVGSQFVKCLLPDGEITPACVNKAEEIAGTLADVPGGSFCIKAISETVNHDYYTIFIL